MKTLRLIRNLFIVIGIFALIGMMFSCDIKTYAQYGYYEIVYDQCPLNTEIEHYRAVGRGFNPDDCNFVLK